MEYRVSANWTASDEFLGDLTHAGTIDFTMTGRVDIAGAKRMADRMVAQKEHLNQRYVFSEISAVEAITETPGYQTVSPEIISAVDKAAKQAVDTGAQNITESPAKQTPSAIVVVVPNKSLAEQSRTMWSDPAAIPVMVIVALGLIGAFAVGMVVGTPGIKNGNRKSQKTTQE